MKFLTLIPLEFWLAILLVGGAWYWIGIPGVAMATIGLVLIGGSR